MGEIGADDLKYECMLLLLSSELRVIRRDSWVGLSVRVKAPPGMYTRRLTRETLYSRYEILLWEEQIEGDFFYPFLAVKDGRYVYIVWGSIYTTWKESCC
jgi:hypothetical protein